MSKKESRLYNNSNGYKSANINRISFYPDTEVFEVKFKNGQVYQYDGVSRELWEQALKAESIGKFMAVSIKGIYKYKRI